MDHQFKHLPVCVLLRVFGVFAEFGGNPLTALRFVAPSLVRPDRTFDGLLSPRSVLIVMLFKEKNRHYIKIESK